MSLDNIGGDLYTLLFHAVFWWIVFIIIEKLPKDYFEKKFGKQIERKEISDLDQDAIEEERRVGEHNNKLLVLLSNNNEQQSSYRGNDWFINSQIYF